MAVEDLVVEHDDVGEAVDRLAVALHHGDRAVRRPAARLAGPVGLDDARHDDQQRVGVGRLRGQQRLGRLAQTRLVGEQERPVAGRGRGDHLSLVRHQLKAGRGEPGGRRRQLHAGRGATAGPLERAQQRAEQFPAGEVARTGGTLRRGREVGGEEGVGQLAGDHRLRHDPRLRAGRADLQAGGSGRGLGRRGLLAGRLDAGVPHRLTLGRPGAIGQAGDAGVLGQQGEQAGVADGGRREDGRDAVQPLELLSPVAGASWRGQHAGALLPQHQGDALELLAHVGRNPAALGSRLHLTDGPGKHREHVAARADALLLARGATASALLTLAWSSQNSSSAMPGHGGHGSMPLSPTGRGDQRPRSGACSPPTPSRLADLEGSTQLATVSVPRGPGAADGRAGHHDTGKSSPGDRFGSRDSQLY